MRLRRGASLEVSREIYISRIIFFSLGFLASCCFFLLVWFYDVGRLFVTPYS